MTLNLAAETLLNNAERSAIQCLARRKVVKYIPVNVVLGVCRDY